MGRVGSMTTRAQRREKLVVAPPAAAARGSVVDNYHVSQTHARFYHVTLRVASRLRTARREALTNETPLTGAQCVADLSKQMRLTFTIFLRRRMLKNR